MLKKVLEPNERICDTKAQKKHKKTTKTEPKQSIKENVMVRNQNKG